jgi:hypothetical protein
VVWEERHNSSVNATSNGMVRRFRRVTSSVKPVIDSPFQSYVADAAAPRSVIRAEKRGLPAQDQRELPEFLCEKRPGGAGHHAVGDDSL